MRKAAKVKLAKHFRSNMTKPEVWLWLALRERRPGSVTFRRQHAIGRYILDFYCAAAKLALEVDGEIHGRDFKIQSDALRDAWLVAQGIQIYRIPAADLLANMSDYVDAIYGLAEQRLGQLKNAPSVTSPA